MITSRVQGGLGNQLFQYAAGLLMAEKHETSLRLDIGSYESFPLRRSHLEELGLKDETFIGVESEKKVTEDAFLQYADHYYKEQVNGYDTGLLEVADETYINGYWQSHRFADEIRDELLSRLEVVRLIQEGAKFDEDSVSVHIRRGDYAAKEVIRNIFGLQSIDYYLEAGKRVAERCTKPTFYIFSDDIEWVRENLHLPGEMCFVSGDESEVQDTTVSDFQKMVGCRHHITANSTFSWWAAYLSASDPEQIVVAPAQWYADASISHEDFVPDHWTRI